MIKPVLELIVDEVVTRLRGITKENGYQFTIVSAERASRSKGDWNPRSLSIIVEYGTVSENDDLSYPGNPPRTAYDMELEINGYANCIDLDDSEVGLADNGVSEMQMIAAIQKALTNGDPANWHTFGDNAINASITGAETFDAPEHDGGKVTLSVTYRTDEQDPYS